MAAPEEPWKQLLSLATLGVNRTQVPAGASVWPAGVSPMPGASAADTVLRAVLTGHLWHSAGARAAAGPFEQPARAPASARSPVPEAAAWRLARMFDSEQRQLIPDWFALAEATQRELPAHWLPTVLERLDEQLRQRFQAVLGPKAVWLGELNPRWRIAPTAPSRELWESGTIEERVTQLRLLRAQDPELGRAWLTESWPDETPNARQILLPELICGLGPRDEEFLEHALDDSRAEVRSAAVRCLIRLPDSAHARRGWQRLQGLITVMSGLRKFNLRIKLPAAPDAEAQRDGIELQRPAELKLGVRTWLLSQMLSRTPPKRWTDHFQCSPGTFLDSLERCLEGPELLPALIVAAVRYLDAPWCSTLFGRLWRNPERAFHHADDLERLLCALPDQQQEPLLVEFMAGATPALVRALIDSPVSWSAASTRAALSRARKLIHSGQPVTLSYFARRAHLAAASQELAAILKPLPQESPVRSQFEPLAEILDFRATMTQEFMGDG